MASSSTSTEINPGNWSADGLESVSQCPVCGGGRRNPAIMRALRDVLAAPVDPVEAVGWDGDALEAQAFAYLAVRSVLGLPLSLPATTGAPHPVSGGRLFRRMSRPA